MGLNIDVSNWKVFFIVLMRKKLIFKSTVKLAIKITKYKYKIQKFQSCETMLLNLKILKLKKCIIKNLILKILKLKF